MNVDSPMLFSDCGVRNRVAPRSWTVDFKRASRVLRLCDELNHSYGTISAPIAKLSENIASFLILRTVPARML